MEEEESKKLLRFSESVSSELGDSSSRRLVKRKAKDSDEQKKHQQQEKKKQQQHQQQQEPLQREQRQPPPEAPLNSLTLDLHNPQHISIRPGGYEMVVVGSLMGLQHLSREASRVRFIEETGLQKLFVLTSADVSRDSRRIQVPVTRRFRSSSLSSSSRREIAVSDRVGGRG